MATYRPLSSGAELRITAKEWDRRPRSDGMLLPLHEWLVENPASAWQFDRKLRLYAVACCRQRSELFEVSLFHRAVDASERLADDPTDTQEVGPRDDAIMAFPTPNARSHRIEEMTLKLLRQSGIKCAIEAALGFGIATGWEDVDSVVRAQAPLLRCVVGNPFRTIAFDPLRQTSRVVEIARAIYADRAFELMPILADALEDAACNLPQRSSQIRGGGPHARGCWVIDKRLGNQETSRLPPPERCDMGGPGILPGSHRRLDFRLPPAPAAPAITSSSARRHEFNGVEEVGAGVRS